MKCPLCQFLNPDTAKRAVESDYWVNGDVIAQQRRNDLPMNTEVRRLKPRKDG